MFCNAAGIDLIKKFEGFRDTAYQDQGGRWTLGYGCAKPFISQGMTCTESQATEWLNDDVQAVALSLTELIKYPLTDNQFSALCSLAYNIGTGNFSKSSALALINTQNLDDVPSHMKLWNKVNGRIDFGLVRRRAAEVALWNQLNG